MLREVGKRSLKLARLANALATRTEVQRHRYRDRQIQRDREIQRAMQRATHQF